MNKINFVNGTEPALNANNLNLMQTNAENAINSVANSIGTGTLTIQKNGSNVATFGANSSSNVTANLSIPTQTSDLTNNSGYITSSSIGNGTLTIQKNGSTVASFGANSGSNVTANISVPVISYGTSLPGSANEGDIFLLYS